MIVADNIQAAMARRGVTASQLARDAKLNPTGIYDIISGKSRSPRLDTINKIAQALRVPVSVLFEDGSDKEVREQIMQVFLQLPPRERRQLLTAAKAWLSDQGQE